jgi:hypothetical protein
LVEFLLNQTLTQRLLDTRPRIMDSAAGSGIFLVESFRRLVRHRVRQIGRSPSRDELRDILRDQIAGIDINPEAVRVAAFSLYLALLHYLDPPTIRCNRLPCLVYPPDGIRLADREYLDILVAGNAFEIEKSVAESDVQSRFGSACADVVVGNPPWGTPTGNDPLAAASREGASRWCTSRELALGDKELSQAFIHRTMDLLKEDGEAALLVSTGVFFKRHDKSRTFRRQWLEKATLQQVVNFAAVRQFFFQRPSKSAPRSESDAEKNGAISPFASVRFRKAPPNLEHQFQYWSVKRTAFVENAEAVILSRTDVHWVSQQQLLTDERLWKVYWWGGHRDAELIQRLSVETKLGGVASVRQDRIGRGWEAGKGAKLQTKLPVLPTKNFRRYGVLQNSDFESPPSSVRRRGDEQCYEGLRLLVKRGISEQGEAKGRIDSRLEDQPFSFRNSIYGISLARMEETRAAKFLLGLMWSSLARYFLFETSGTWGPWHNELRPESIVQIPVRFPDSSAVWTNIISIVDKLRAAVSLPSEAPNAGGSCRKGRRNAPADSQRWIPFSEIEGETPTSQNADRLDRDAVRRLETELDRMLFDLYELTEEERDLICEMCDFGLDHLYLGPDSKAVKRLDVAPNARRVGRRRDLAEVRGIAEELRDYIRIFLELSDPRLNRQRGWLRWQIVLADGDASMLGIIFSTESEDERLPDPPDDDESAWRWILTDLAESCAQTAWAKEVYIDGILQLVTAHDIAIVKRNERRLWTRTAAREDAEATMAQVLLRSNKQDRKERA